MKYSIPDMVKGLKIRERKISNAIFQNFFKRNYFSVHYDFVETYAFRKIFSPCSYIRYTYIYVYMYIYYWDIYLRISSNKIRNVKVYGNGNKGMFLQDIWRYIISLLLSSSFLLSGVYGVFVVYLDYHSFYSLHNFLYTERISCSETEYLSHLYYVENLIH